MDNKIKSSEYPDNIKEILEKYYNNIYSISDIITLKTKNKLGLVTYKDQLLNIIWVIDLTKFTHPFGIGPDNNRFMTLNEKFLDITDEFNDASHSNNEIEFLLSKVIGRLNT